MGETEKKRTWFACECGARITTGTFPVRCEKCDRIWLDKTRQGIEGWDIVSAPNLVNVVCRKLVDGEWKTALMSAVYSGEREKNLARLKKKYGEGGENIPWEHVKKSGAIEVPYTNNAGTLQDSGADRKERGERALALRKSGKTWKEVGEELGCSSSAAKNAVKAIAGDDFDNVVGRRGKPGGKKTAKHDAVIDKKAAELRRTGHKFREIADQLGFKYPSAARAAAMRGGAEM